MNYGFEKRQREIRKQKKKAEKAERKRLDQEEAAGVPTEGATEDGATGADSVDRD